METNTQGNFRSRPLLSWLPKSHFFVAWGRSTPDFGWPEVPTSMSNGGGHDPINFGFPPTSSSHLAAAGASSRNLDQMQSWYSSSAMMPTSAGGFWQSSGARYPPTYPPGPGSGMSRESSRDDLTSMELDQVFDYEERFRVDRRKLELLMMGRFEPIKETAADYFQRVSSSSSKASGCIANFFLILQIGEDTNTTVIWPSRLKVGAKSKKGERSQRSYSFRFILSIADPHIRIGGQEEGVTMAKAMIMEHLDTKTRRVTMKMDVSYTDHSHIIGKGGNTIRRVMSETGCHIHFPDSNRSNPNEKSNQVSIAGSNALVIYESSFCPT